MRHRQRVLAARYAEAALAAVRAAATSAPLRGVYLSVRTPAGVFAVRPGDELGLRRIAAEVLKEKIRRASAAAEARGPQAWRAWCCRTHPVLSSAMTTLASG